MMRTSTKHNNRGRIKFFSCFGPAVTPDVPVKRIRKGGSGDPFLGYVGGDESLMFSKILTDSPSEEDVSGRRKEKSSRKFSSILKSLFSEKSLRLKIRFRKRRQNSFESSTYEKISKSKNENLDLKESSEADYLIGIRSNSDRASSLISSSTNAAATATSSTSYCSSCTSSSIMSNSHSVTERNGSFCSNLTESKQVSTPAPAKDGGGISLSLYGSNVWLCLILLCLLVLIIWGKLCAIVCTSAWLFFLPRRSKRFDSPVNEDVDSSEYKKRIIMEGLLERNRNRV